MTLPFNGAISQFLATKAPEDLRAALQAADKDAILTPGFPYKKRLSKKHMRAIMLRCKSRW